MGMGADVDEPHNPKNKKIKNTKGGHFLLSFDFLVV